jgi:hypothetical protein
LKNKNFLSERDKIEKYFKTPKGHLIKNKKLRKIHSLINNQSRATLNTPGYLRVLERIIKELE